MGFLYSIFGSLLTWWGLFVVSALDSTMFVVVPFANDTLVIYLAARNRELFWTYPLIAAAGSLLGAALTYWIGKKAGESGLPRLVSERRLNRLREKLNKSGATALAVPAALPPPFPLTPFILACGALDVSESRFFSTFAAMRILRFGVEALLARRYGERLVMILESHTFRLVIFVLVGLAVVGTIASVVVLWQRTRQPSPQDRQVG
jgi:membrane protein YqaA with SNARE-associated domain